MSKSEAERCEHIVQIALLLYFREEKMEKFVIINETFFLKAKTFVVSPVQVMSYEIAQLCSS